MHCIPLACRNQGAIAGFIADMSQCVCRTLRPYSCWGVGAQPVGLAPCSSLRWLSCSPAALTDPPPLGTRCCCPGAPSARTHSTQSSHRGGSQAPAVAACLSAAATPQLPMDAGGTASIHMHEPGLAHLLQSIPATTPYRAAVLACCCVMALVLARQRWPAAHRQAGAGVDVV